MALLDVFLLILLSALWGASYLFIRIAGPALGPPRSTALGAEGAP